MEQKYDVYEITYAPAGTSRAEREAPPPPPPPPARDFGSIPLPEPRDDMILPGLDSRLSQLTPFPDDDAPTLPSRGLRSLSEHRTYCDLLARGIIDIHGRFFPYG